MELLVAIDNGDVKVVRTDSKKYKTRTALALISRGFVGGEVMQSGEAFGKTKSFGPSKADKKYIEIGSLRVTEKGKAFLKHG